MSDWNSLLQEGVGRKIGIEDAPADQIAQAVEQILTSWQTSGLCAPSKVLILNDRSTMDRTALGGIESLYGHLECNSGNDSR